MNISELSNTPREVTLENRTFRVRRLKIKELFGFFEEKIRAKKIKEAQEISASLPPEERTSFMVKVWKELPSGSELTDMVTDTMSSVDGIYDVLHLASRDFNEISVEEIKDVVSLEKIDQLTPVVNWILGTGEIEQPEASSNSSEKKTEPITEKE